MTKLCVSLYSDLACKRLWITTFQLLDHARSSLWQQFLLGCSNFWLDDGNCKLIIHTLSFLFVIDVGFANKILAGESNIVFWSWESALLIFQNTVTLVVCRGIREWGGFELAFKLVQSWIFMQMVRYRHFVRDVPFLVNFWAQDVRSRLVSTPCFYRARRLEWTLRVFIVSRSLFWFLLTVVRLWDLRNQRRSLMV